MKNKSENNQQLILSMGKGDDEILFKKDFRKSHRPDYNNNNKSYCKQQR